MPNLEKSGASTKSNNIGLQSDMGPDFEQIGEWIIANLRENFSIPIAV
jgi:hypothetical protein